MVRRLPAVDIAPAQAFLKEQHRGVFQTYRRDGSVQLSPVSCGLAADGRLVVSTRETAMKTHNVRRDPRASACVFSERFFGEWIQVEGTVEVVSLPDAMEGLVEYYRSISGEHPDWDDYKAAMVRDRRVLLLMTIERAGPDSHG
jgi:PPOX class probable F420-dependent enzyme